MATQEHDQGVRKETWVKVKVEFSDGESIRECSHEEGPPQE
jgi:hypothetical protein